MHDILRRFAIEGSVALSAVLLLNACAPVDGAEKATADAEQTVEDAAVETTVRKPEGAVLIEDDLYAVPLAVDKDGCELFKTWSQTGAIPLGQPIYYRDGQGSFSLSRSEDGSCKTQMIETGIDEEGCPTFRAQQPDGSATEVHYFRSTSGFTTTRERAVCDS